MASIVLNPQDTIRSAYISTEETFRGIYEGTDALARTMTSIAVMYSIASLLNFPIAHSPLFIERFIPGGQILTLLLVSWGLMSNCMDLNKAFGISVAALLLLLVGQNFAG